MVLYEHHNHKYLLYVEIQINMIQASCDYKTLHIKSGDNLQMLLDVYHILGIVCGRKLSQITFIDVVYEKTFARSPILHSPIISYIRFWTLFSQIQVEKIAIFIN